MSKRLGSICAIFLMWMIAACSDSAPIPVRTEAPEALHTTGAQTVIAMVTLTAQLSLPTILPPTQTTVPTEIPQATATPHPSDTPTTAPSSTPVPTDTPQPVQSTYEPIAGALIQDDFSNNQSGWREGSDRDRSEFGYSNGYYQIDIREPNVEVWSIIEQEFKDVRIEVDIVKPKGEEDAYFGVICRWEDDDNYYRITVEAGGAYQIGARINGKTKNLLRLVPSQTGRKDEFPMRFAVVCRGEKITLYSNGRRIMEIQDVRFKSGFVGLLAGTQKGRRASILFDNFVVLNP